VAVGLAASVVVVVVLLLVVVVVAAAVVVGLVVVSTLVVVAGLVQVVLVALVVVAAAETEVLVLVQADQGSTVVVVLTAGLLLVLVLEVHADQGSMLEDEVFTAAGVLLELGLQGAQVGSGFGTQIGAPVTISTTRLQTGCAGAALAMATAAKMVEVYFMVARVN